MACANMFATERTALHSERARVTHTHVVARIQSNRLRHRLADATLTIVGADLRGTRCDTSRRSRDIRRRWSAGTRWYIASPQRLNATHVCRRRAHRGGKRTARFCTSTGLVWCTVRTCRLQVVERFSMESRRFVDFAKGVDVVLVQHTRDDQVTNADVPRSAHDPSRIHFLDVCNHF